MNAQQKPEIEGYCPVAYFLADKPMIGDAKFSSTHNGKIYHLLNADAKKEFDSNPSKYIPAFDGQCAFGLSIGKNFPVDPTSFKIVEEKLLLFLKNNEIDALGLWNKENEADLLAKAEKNFNK